MQVCTLDQLNGSLSLVNQLQDNVACYCLFNALQKEGLVCLCFFLRCILLWKGHSVCGPPKPTEYGFLPSSGPSRRDDRLVEQWTNETEKNQTAQHIKRRLE